MEQLISNLNPVLDGAMLFFFFTRVLRYFRRRNESTLMKVVFIIMSVFTLLTVKAVVLDCFPSLAGHHSYLLMNADRMTELLALPTFGMYAIELVYPGWPLRWYNTLRLYLPVLLLVPLSFFYTGDMLFIISMLFFLLTGLAMAVFLAVSVKRQKYYYMFAHKEYKMVTHGSVKHTLIAYAVYIVLFFFAYYFDIPALHVALKIFIFTCFIFVSMPLDMQLAARFGNVEAVPETGDETLDSSSAEAGDNEDEEQDEDLLENLGDRIDAVIRDKELYLKADLTINDIAYELGTNRTYISNCLNKEKNIKFYEYVNEFRVQKAVEIMEKHVKESPKEKLLMEAVMYDCGFNSLNTFKRAFARQMNCRPVEYFAALKARAEDEKTSE